MRPRIRHELKSLLKRQRIAGTEVLVLEAALLQREDWKGVIDEIWVTCADQSLVVERLKKGRGYDEGEVLSRLQQQLSPEEMRAQADIIINTNCSLAELKQFVEEQWGRLKKRIC
jgi:dephospho-CoA kinase